MPKTARRAGATDGTSSARPEAEQRGLRPERFEGVQANGFRSACRSGQGAASTRWPQSQRWPVRAARRERFSAEPIDQPTEELLEIADALQPSRWQIRHGSSHAANGCRIAVASLATGLIAAFCSALLRSSAR